VQCADSAFFKRYSAIALNRAYLLYLPIAVPDLLPLTFDDARQPVATCCTARPFRANARLMYFVAAGSIGRFLNVTMVVPSMQARRQVFYIESKLDAVIATCLYDIYHLVFYELRLGGLVVYGL
jgi:hypothetical protein